MDADYEHRRTKIPTELNRGIDYAKYYQCHVVALGRTTSERGSGLHNPTDNPFRRQTAGFSHRFH